MLEINYYLIQSSLYRYDLVSSVGFIWEMRNGPPRTSFLRGNAGTQTSWFHSKTLKKKKMEAQLPPHLSED